MEDASCETVVFGDGGRERVGEARLLYLLDEPSAGASRSTATSATATPLTPLTTACESHNPIAYSVRRKSERRAGMVVGTAVQTEDEKRAGEEDANGREMDAV